MKSSKKTLDGQKNYSSKLNFGIYKRVLSRIKLYGMRTTIRIILCEIPYIFSQKQMMTEVKLAKADNGDYVPTPIYHLDQIMKELKKIINIKESTFCDLGAGMGRILIHAHKHGFKKIIGVEIIPEIYEICKKNISDYSNIVIHNTNASQFDYSKIDVFFFFQSFKGKTFSVVINKIKESTHRPIFFVEVNPHHGYSAGIEQQGFTKIIANLNKQNMGYMIWCLK